MYTVVVYEDIERPTNIYIEEKYILKNDKTWTYNIHIFHVLYIIRCIESFLIHNLTETDMII